MSTRRIRLPLLHQAQIRIKTEAGRYNVINCGRRFGKDILCIDLIIWPALDGYPVGWFQPSYKSLLEVWRMMKRVLLPVTSSTSEQDKRIELITGGVIDFWSLDGDPEACRGRKYKRVIINEAAKARYLRQAWEMAIRPTLTDYQGDAFFPSTPRGRDFYCELYERAGQEKYPRWRSWRMPTSENPYISPSEIEEAKADLPSDVFNQEYLAEFLDVGGRFFQEWEAERVYTDFDEISGKFVEKRRPWHVVDVRPLPKHWEYWGGLDYGTTPTQRTFAFLLFAIDEAGTIYVVDEVYEAGLEAPQQVPHVLECLKRNGLARPIDPENERGEWWISPKFTSIQMDPGFGFTSTFPPAQTNLTKTNIERAKQAQGKYPAEYYWDFGLPAQEAVTDRIAGWRQMKSIIHGYRVVSGKGDREEDTEPLIRAFRGKCSNLLRTLPQMVRSSNMPEDIEGANVDGGEHKQEDHLVCAARYGLMTRKPPSGPAPEEQPDEPDEQGYNPLARDEPPASYE